MADKGSKRILHCEVLKIKELKHDSKKSDKKIEIKYDTKDFRGDISTGVVTFYNGKYELSGFKALKKTLDTLLEGDEELFTLYQTRGEEFWNTDDIVLGHQGTHGLVNTGGTVQKVSGGGSGYDNDGARAGNLLTNSVHILVGSGKKNISIDDIIEKARELNEAAERIKAEVINGKSTTVSNVKEEADEEEEDEKPRQKKAVSKKKIELDEGDDDPFDDE